MAAGSPTLTPFSSCTFCAFGVPRDVKPRCRPRLVAADVRRVEDEARHLVFQDVPDVLAARRGVEQHRVEVDVDVGALGVDDRRSPLTVTSSEIVLDLHGDVAIAVWPWPTTMSSRMTVWNPWSAVLRRRCRSKGGELVNAAGIGHADELAGRTGLVSVTVAPGITAP